MVGSVMVGRVRAFKRLPNEKSGGSCGVAVLATSEVKVEERCFAPW